MKKLLVLALMLALIVSIAACAPAAQEPADQPAEQPAEEPEDELEDEPAEEPEEVVVITAVGYGMTDEEYEAALADMPTDNYVLAKMLVNDGSRKLTLI